MAQSDATTSNPTSNQQPVHIINDEQIEELLLLAERSEPLQREPQLSHTEYALQFIEAASNMFFYLLALFIVIVPPLKWLGDLFSGEETTWKLLAAIVVFAFIVPSLAPIVMNYLIDSLEKIKKGEWFGPLFRPLRAICAVISMYGILMLEYKIIHGHESKSLFEVYWELVKSL